MPINKLYKEKYMKYISISEAAKKLNLSERSVRNYCQHGRIPGAVLEGKTWLIPENFTKPERTNGKENDNNDEFIATGYELIRFLDSSPVNFFAIDNVRKELINSGFEEIFENKSCEIKRGGKYFVVRNGTSIIGLDIGELVDDDNCSFHVIASHSDSPCFKIKPECDSKSGSYNRINVEPYGGLIMSTWLDRPLSIAGRVIVKNDDSLESKLLNMNNIVTMIPNVCIHFNREINQGYKYDPSVDLQAFISQDSEGQPFKELIAKELKVKLEDIVNFDLYLYNKEQGYLWGNKKEFVSSSRLDDLECVFSSMKAFKDSHNKKAINVLYVADNEEVGSSSRQGADSDFLQNVLQSIASKLGINYYTSIANSFLISADNAHAVHPNKPGLSDPNNKPLMNHGVAIKYNASQSYTSDAVSGAIFQKLCENANAPYQYFANRSDIRGGSTLGNILLNHVSLLSVDMGLPQLAMHSSFETAGTYDIKHAVDVFKEFYSSVIEINGNRYTIRKEEE